MAMMVDQQTISTRTWVELGVLGVIWGGSYIGARMTLEEFGVLSTVALRMLGASVMIWAYVWWRGLPVPRNPRVWGAFVISGIIGNALPYSLISWGQLTVPAGLAAILLCSATIFSMLIAAAMFADERLSPRRLCGAMLGLAGVTLALGPENLMHFNPGSVGQLACLAAALSYGLAANFARASFSGVAPQVITAGVLTMASLLMLPAAIAVDGLPTLDHSLKSWAVLAALALIATGLAYLLLFRLIVTAGASNASLNTLISAPTAMILGAVVLGEVLPARAYPGFLLIALGLLVIDGRAMRHFSRALRAPAR